MVVKPLTRMVVKPLRCGLPRRHRQLRPRCLRRLHGPPRLHGLSNMKVRSSLSGAIAGFSSTALRQPSMVSCGRICMTAPSKRARTVVLGAYVSQYRKKFRPLLPQMRRPALVPLGHHLSRQQGSSTSRRTSKAAAVAAAAVAPTAAIYVKLFSLYNLALVYGANQDRCLSLRVESL